MADGNDISAVFNRLNSRISELADTVDDVRSRVAALDHDMDRVKKAIDSLHGDVKTLENRMDAAEDGMKRIESGLDEFGQQVKETTQEIRTGNSSLADVASALRVAGEREAEGREKQNGQLRKLREQQIALHELLESGLAKTTGQLAELTEHEKQLQSQVAQSAESFRTELDRVAVRLHEPLGEIGEMIEKLEEGVREGQLQHRQEAESLEAVLNRLGSGVEVILHTEDRLQTDLGAVATGEETAEQESVVAAAIAANAAGLRLLACGQPEAARERFVAAAQLAPATFEPRCNRVVAALLAGNLGDAREALANLVDAFPDQALCRDLAGLVALRANDATTAADSWRTQASSASASLVGGIGLAQGLALLLTGNVQESRRHFAAACAASVADRDRFIRLGFLPVEATAETALTGS